MTRRLCLLVVAGGLAVLELSLSGELVWSRKRIMEAEANLERLRLLHDLVHGLLPDAAVDLPRGEDVPLLEDLLDLLERAADGLGVHEEDVDARGGVEGREDEVRLVRDVLEAGRHSVREGEVEEPVGRGGERDGLAADFEGELGRVSVHSKVRKVGIGHTSSAGYVQETGPMVMAKEQTKK